MYSISQFDTQCFNKMIHCGADIDKKQLYNSQRVKPMVQILYEAAHCLHKNKKRHFKICINFLNTIVKNGANINTTTTFFGDRDNAFMGLFLYIKSINIIDICVNSFVKLFVTMLNLGANPNYKQNYQGGDIDGCMNNLDLFCQFMVYGSEDEDAPYYLPLFQQFFLLGDSLIHNTDTFTLIESNYAYCDTVQLFEEWPMQMIFYCLEQKHTFVIL